MSDCVWSSDIMETWGDVSPHFTRHLPTNVSLDDALLLKLL